MKYQITAGTETLALATVVAENANLAALTVEGAFLVYKLTGTADEAKATVTLLGDVIVSLRDEAIEAGESLVGYDNLINTTVGLLRDIDRDFNVVTQNKASAEATEANQESQPTGDSDSSISELSQQLSNSDTHEELSDEAQEQSNSGRTGRNRTK
jgi:phage shock protein A